MHEGINRLKVRRTNKQLITPTHLDDHQVVRIGEFEHGVEREPRAKDMGDQDRTRLACHGAPQEVHVDCERVGVHIHGNRDETMVAHEVEHVGDRDRTAEDLASLGQLERLEQQIKPGPLETMHAHKMVSTSCHPSYRTERKGNVPNGECDHRVARGVPVARHFRFVLLALGLAQRQTRLETLGDVFVRHIESLARENRPWTRRRPVLQRA